MKKIDVEDFCEELEEVLSSFREDMVSRNFSPRNQREWFKLLSDYVGVSTIVDDDDDSDDSLYSDDEEIDELA